MFSLPSQASLVITFFNDGSDGVNVNFQGSGVTTFVSGSPSNSVEANVGDAFNVNSQFVTLADSVSIAGASLLQLILDDDPGLGDDFVMLFASNIAAGTSYSVNQTSALSGMSFSDLNLGQFVGSVSVGVGFGGTTLVVSDTPVLPVPTPATFAGVLLGLGLLGMRKRSMA